MRGSKKKYGEGHEYGKEKYFPGIKKPNPASGFLKKGPALGKEGT